MSIDRYELDVAMQDAKKSIDCPALDGDFTDSIRTLIQGAEAYLELKDDDCKMDMLKSELTDLRATVEEAQGAVSDLDDKMGDIYSKLEDVDCMVSEMEE